MIAAAGAARIREDQDALGATHEGVGLDQVGAPRATFDVLPPPAILDDAARSPCHFGDSVGPKPGDDMIERGSYRRQRAELFEQLVAHPHRSLADDRSAASGRASCRDRGCQYGSISVVAGTLKKNT